ITPLARRKMTENNLNVDDIIKGLRRITTNEIDRVIKSNHNLKSEGGQTGYGKRNVNRQPMSPLRRKLSKRLVAVKNETAMLTTFNEVDMSAMLEIRRRYQQSFQERHGIKLGLMSFFARASAQALLQFPLINSALEEDEIITPSFVDLGIAVQTEKGLMVPVIRNAESMSIPELEKHIAELARKARSKQITIEEMTGGTFTITNGGVFGSMLSTPILNPPQSAILGMHNIVERPVAIRGQVEIRPVMYVALSYDHRIIDGSSSVQFLVRIKELIETPLKMLSLNDPEKDLLQL
ncbi:MAG: dihydrolipoyllysine-residue succinyltransferase, partial [Bacteroidales bacterium]|nr:dihydrolipoyllysine-residue succinyltransferase [Bacteroidales bacterium]